MGHEDGPDLVGSPLQGVDGGLSLSLKLDRNALALEFDRQVDTSEVLGGNLDGQATQRFAALHGLLRLDQDGKGKMGLGDGRPLAEAVDDLIGVNPGLGDLDRYHAQGKHGRSTGLGGCLDRGKHPDGNRGVQVGGCAP
jgi:hypothetical protein